MELNNLTIGYKNDKVGKMQGERTAYIMSSDDRAKKPSPQSETDFEAEVIEAEVDRMTIDDILIEHPGVSEPQAKSALKRIKAEEAIKKPKTKLNKPENG